MLTGETVTVRTPSISHDEHMDEIETWSEETVDGVLVAPGSTSDLADAIRPHGTTAALTLAFPKTFGKPLRGCRVVVRGRELAVVGDPQPCTAANCPTRWWYTVEVEDVDG